jgi:hypothetical protein
VLGLGLGASHAPAASGDEAASAVSAMSEAWTLSERAQTLALAQQPAAALVDWERAYGLSRDPLLLLEIARMERQMGSDARATHAYERFLGQSSDGMPPRLRNWAERQLRATAAHTARLNVQTNVLGAAVDLEATRGVATTQGFVVSLLLDAGERRFSISKSGYETQSLVVSLEPGESRSLRVDLDKASGGRSSEGYGGAMRLTERNPDTGSRDQGTAPRVSGSGLRTARF